MLRTSTASIASAAVATASTAVASSSTATAAAGAIRGLVNADGAAVESVQVSMDTASHRHVFHSLRKGDLLNVVHVLHGIVGLGLLRESHETEATATACIAVLDDNLARIRSTLIDCEAGGFPVSSAWEVWMRVEGKRAQVVRRSSTHSLFNLAEFLKLLAEGAIVGVPGKATVGG